MDTTDGILREMEFPKKYHLFCERGTGMELQKVLWGKGSGTREDGSAYGLQDGCT